MTDLERVHEGEIVEDRPEWELLISEWGLGASQELAGQLRQARAAAAVGRHYGRSSMLSFARDVGVSKSKVYSYARVWWIYGHLFEDGEFSSRLETLSMAHLIECSYAPDPVQTLEEAHDEGKSARQIEAERKEREIEEAEEEHGKAEVVETPECPTCGALPDHWQRPPRGSLPLAPK